MSNKFNSIWEVPTHETFRVVGEGECKSVYIYSRNKYDDTVIGASIDKDGRTLPYGTKVHFSKLRK